jgi:hypothetical protein
LFGCICHTCREIWPFQHGKSKHCCKRRNSTGSVGRLQ